MDDHDWLAERFEANRSHLRAVAYRMLGSLAEADDAVQDAWLRLSRVDTSSVDNLGGWLTTVVARVWLDMLRARTSRREEPLEEPLDAHLPDPIVRNADGVGVDPEQEALLAEGVGLALLVVLETLAPAERVAFVLHDLFAVPFDEIAPIVARSPNAAKMLASRARRRVQGAVTVPDTDLPRQRAVVDAFLAASRGGDFDALLALLDPDSCSAPTARPCRRARRRRSAVRRPWPAPSRGVPGSHNRRSWTEPWAPCGLRADGHRSSSASRSRAGRSSPSTSSPTPRAWASSTWQSSTTDAPSRLPSRPRT